MPPTPRRARLVLAGSGLAVLACVSLLPARPPAEGKKYAVLVGVKDYDHAKFRILEYAVNDVAELGVLLRDHGYEVTLLRSGATEPNLRPTLANVNARLGEVLEKCKRDDTVLVALSGHGLQFEKQKPADPDDAYFCPSDARPFPDRRETLL